MNSALFVSVVIPCYNAATSLARAVGSIARQGIYGIEILIVDDQSTDDSRAVAQALAREFANVRLFTQAVNADPAANHNTVR